MDERGVLPVTNLSVHRCALAAEMVLLASCSQEDDGYDNADMYTLAEMGTRLGDPEPGGDDSNMYLRGGSKEAHIWVGVDGLHIYFDVSWEEGRWNQVHPHLKYKRCDNCSGYSIFKKPNGEKDSIHTFIYVDYSTEEGPKVHFDEIIISDFKVYVKQAVKKEFEDGSYIYEYSPIVMPRSPQFSVDISNYAN